MFLVLSALLIGASGAGSQSTDEIHRLATLVFLKSFHPGVATGPIDWEHEIQ